MAEYRRGMTLISAIVSGMVVFSDAAPTISGAVAYIFVEEVSRADAPASLVARLEIPDLTLQPRNDSLPFSLRVEGIDPKKRYTVRVHIDADRNGRITPGDFISTESYPVMTQGAPAHVQVHVRRI